jgi:hypothetical protein
MIPPDSVDCGLHPQTPGRKPGSGGGLGRQRAKGEGKGGWEWSWVGEGTGGERGWVAHPHPPFQNPGSATERRRCVQKIETEKRDIDKRHLDNIFVCFCV